MTPRSTDTWSLAWETANQRVLAAELARVCDDLGRRGECSNGASRTETEGPSPTKALEQALEEARALLPAPAALDELCAIFGLSAFERKILLLCAGVELDSTFAERCRQLQGRHGQPTFSLALALWPEAHWSALAPGSALRSWRLVEIGDGPLLTASTLRIDEPILHFLAGIRSPDDRLTGYSERLPPVPLGSLVPSHRRHAEVVVREWREPESARPATIQLFGPDPATKRRIAAAAADVLQVQVFCLRAERLPAAAAELSALQRLAEREAALFGGVLLIELDHARGGGRSETESVAWAGRCSVPMIVSAPEPAVDWPCPGLNLEARKPTTAEQQTLWRVALGTRLADDDGVLDSVAGQFDLSAPVIDEVSRRVKAAVRGGGECPEVEAPELARELWEACRAQARAKLDQLAQRIVASVTWEDLVLPPLTLSLLREMGAQVRCRNRVYEEWGFAAKSVRGLGISALFAGPSGTGKTLAAEVVANELHLDLYHIDLSQIVSKYIGETEKNLRRVFAAAEAGGAVLLFDEADALFGKRSEVKDSHDRYANVEVSYLLQRMETYRGLSILTTNRKEALDAAFLRRLRFVVTFPFPDAALRKGIWQRIFPSATPLESLDYDRLARVNLTGGHIRNIALNAAFHAAQCGEPVRMPHLVRAARSEYAKFERRAPENEIEGWL